MLRTLAEAVCGEGKPSASSSCSIGVSSVSLEVLLVPAFMFSSIFSTTMLLLSLL